MPGRGLERAQSIERWQPGGHFPGLLCMSLHHAKRHKVSFVESADNTNITGNKLALGAQNVHILASINDK
jgi:hypothetical protein